MRHRGFTLLELLIALALIGLMVALLFGALRFAGKAWDASDARLEHNTAMSMVWRYLDARFSQARNLKRKLEEGEEAHFFFQGNHEAVEFVAPMPAHLGAGGLYIIRIYRQRENGKGKLMMTRWLYHPEVLAGESGLPAWRPLGALGITHDDRNRNDLRAWYSSSTLLEDVKSLEFSYYGRADPDAQSADWSDTWEDRKLMPILVRMKLVDERGEWPEMTFSLPGA